MRQTITTYLVDAFTDQPFKGNPAGVCMLETPLEATTMQLIAQELGYSETAFVLPASNAPRADIRFFSPKMEIPLCGHATLSASKVVFERQPDLEAYVFVNLDGLELAVQKDQDFIQMVFPVYDTIPQTAPAPLLEALGLETIVNSAFNPETNILLLEIESSTVLSGLAPNFDQLLAAHDAINGVVVTAPSQRDGFDFESRYFWPWSGTLEDPVTGATHTFLTPYWSQRLQKDQMRAFQCSRRTGFLEVALLDAQHMTIKGKAQIILVGTLML